MRNIFTTWPYKTKDVDYTITTVTDNTAPKSWAVSPNGQWVQHPPLRVGGEGTVDLNWAQLPQAVGAWWPAPILAPPEGATFTVEDAEWSDDRTVLTVRIGAGWQLRFHRDLVDKLLAPTILRALGDKP